MNRWKLPVAVLAALGWLSLGAAAQSTQDNQSNSGAPAATQDNSSTPDQKPQTAAEKKAAEKAAKEKAREEAKQAKNKGKPESEDQSAKIRMPLVIEA